MDIHTSKSPEETFRLAEQFGREVAPGLVIGLVGDLGAGKTQYVKGFARGLGVQERIHSPTFTLVNEYRSGRFPCFHLDLYRLNNAEQVVAAGLESYFRPTDGITLIEWFDRAPDLAPEAARVVVVHLSQGQEENERVIAYENPRT